MTAKAQFAKEQSPDGEFERQEDAFRKFVSQDGSTGYPVAAGRYHLYISLACPWACRTLIFRNLKGLEEVIGVTVVDPFRDEKGWAFREGPGFTADPINGFSYLSEAYQASNPDFDPEDRVTVPVLWDKETKCIVNNSEDDICLMLNEEFNAFARHPEVDLYPKALQADMERWNTLIYEQINNGVYRAGFATSQTAYEKACHLLFAALDELDARLSSRRYIMGSGIVETDWRLFCTLIRFDVVYYSHFKCNFRRILDYPNLHGYLLDLYQQPGIAETIDFDHIKRHYYQTHDEINPTRIVPIGPLINWNEPPNIWRTTEY